MIPSAFELRRLGDSTLLVVAVSYGLLLAVSAFGGLFGLALYVLLYLSLWRYGYQVARTVAQGRARIAAPDVDDLQPFGELALVLHYALFAGLLAVLLEPRLFGSGAGFQLLRWSGVAVLAAAFPASIGLMAVTRDLAAALNPRSILSLIHVLGRDYGLLLVIVAVLFLLPQWIGALQVPLVGAWLSAAAEVWVLLAVFCLTGAAIHAHRDELDVPGRRESEDERRYRDAKAAWRGQLDLAYASIRSGLNEQGYRTISALLHSASMSVEAHDWVLSQMLTWEDRTHAAAFARDWVERLLAQGEQQQALELAARCRSFASGPWLDDVTAQALGAYARSIGRHRLADELSAR